MKRTTNTAHRPTARSMERMVAELGPKGSRAWDLLGPVADGTLSLGELHDWWRRNDLDGLRARLADVDLEPHVAIWANRHRSKAAADTVAHYVHALRTLMAAGSPFPRSGFTVDAIDAWLAAYPGGAGTRRKAHVAASVFARYLVKAKVLRTNPVRDVDAPPAGPPRLRYLSAADMQRLADAQPEPYRTLSALLGGTGIEVSVAVRLRRSDVDIARREIRAAGTKTHARDRIVRASEWSWPFIAHACVGLLPNAPLFPKIDRWLAGDAHRAACAALEFEDYQLRDQRHSYAVRAARAGTPAELIARQLGHANAVLVLKVYGRFMPSQQERDRWEKIAALQDAESIEMGRATGRAPRNETSKPALSDWPISSRGGTRTRDPGIM
ncbi:MAG: tyrosine-type recombinase/integrase, partial [Gemmatimonadaceae bacterium]